MDVAVSIAAGDDVLPEATVVGLVFALVTALRATSPELSADEAGDKIGQAVRMVWAKPPSLTPINS